MDRNSLKACFCIYCKGKHIPVSTRTLHKAKAKDPRYGAWRMLSESEIEDMLTKVSRGTP